MLFNSAEFIAFFLVVYAAYLVLPHRGQNLFLLVASYVFYGAWDWRFLGLIWLSTFVDFVVAQRIADSQSERVRRAALWISVACNLSILGFFKYFNFFAESLVALGHPIGWDPGWVSLQIVLPVGISFYTFQSMGYTIDVYRRHTAPVRRLQDLALYVAYFPQLVAGPIERSRQLLPQLQGRRSVTGDHISNGLWLITLGYFLKVLVADNLGPLVESVYSAGTAVDGGLVLIATYAFAVQILGDFAGYSCIAIGVSSLMGIRLMRNFRSPYFSRNPSEFWTRWHISLSSWLRDYLYIPLGGNRRGPSKTARNLAVTMLLGGLWHGASWNFVAWGAWHGLLLVCYRALGATSTGEQVIRERFAPGNLLAIMLMFHWVCVGWMLFRVESLPQFATMFEALLGISVAQLVQHSTELKLLIKFAAPVVLLEFWFWLGGDERVFHRAPAWFRSLLYLLMWGLVLLFGEFGQDEFIYFQF